ncbi:MAG: hypothetical protein KDD61_15685, partial [Bdellovibrionales bacterium]|nr:hypothetical protein [Bdellovibrionales bacterium]
STLHTYLLSIHSGDHRVFHIDQVVGSFTCETGDASSSLLNCLPMRWQLDLPYQADQEKRSYKLQIQLHQKEDWQSQLHHENLSLSLFANAQSFEFTFLPENIRVLQKSLFLKETAFTEPCRTEYFRVYGSYLNENRDLETIFLCLEPENSLRFLNFRSAHRIGKDNLFRGRISLKINAFSKDGRDRVHYMIESEKIP